jgi:hypothetical protein
MAPKLFRVTRRIIIFLMICWLGNMLWKNHTTPHYETPAGSPKVNAQTIGSPKSDLQTAASPAPEVQAGTTKADVHITIKQDPAK